MIFESNPEAKKITMRGGIGDFENHISADDFIAVLAEHSGDIEIELDSPGGSVTDGLAIYNAISNYDGKVTVHIDTLAASIATVVACAADYVKMNSNGKYFIHRAWTVAMGNCKEFRSMADLMEMMDGDIADVYGYRTGIPKDELLDMMDKETWLSAQDAAEKGFVDEVIEVKSKEKPKAEAKPVVKAICPAVQIAASEAGRRLRVKYGI
jgi:ATP-dependent protease ClpP protease subunit